MLVVLPFTRSLSNEAFQDPANGLNAATFDPALEAMNFVMFDARTSIQLGCGNVATAPLFSVGVYTVTYTITQILDVYGFEPNQCRKGDMRLYQNASAPFLSYAPAFGASVISRNASDCYPSADGSEFMCPFGIFMHSGSQVAQTLTSSPSISKVDIALNAGAVVGGAQFFFWFFTTLMPTKVAR